MKEIGNTPVSWNNLLTLHTRLSSQLPGVQPIKWQWAQFWQKSIPRPLHPSIVQVHHEQSAKPNNQHPFCSCMELQYSKNKSSWCYFISCKQVLSLAQCYKEKPQIYSHLWRLVHFLQQWTVFSCYNTAFSTMSWDLSISKRGNGVIHYSSFEYIISYKCVCMSHVLEMGAYVDIKL